MRAEFVLLIINSLTGLFLIGLGYAVKAYPDLIAGYNTMSESKKIRFDIDGFSTKMKKNLVIQGRAIIVLSVLFTLFRVDKMFSLHLMTVVMVVGCVFLFVGNRKYIKKPPPVKPPTIEDYDKLMEKLKNE